jgi:hypothetical protein
MTPLVYEETTRHEIPLEDPAPAEITMEAEQTFEIPEDSTVTKRKDSL